MGQAIHLRVAAVLFMAATSCGNAPKGSPTSTASSSLTSAQPALPRSSTQISSTRAAHDPALTTWYFDVKDGAWHAEESATRVGLHWMIERYNEKMRGRFIPVGMSCNDIDLGATKPGEVAVCVPSETTATARFVPDPSLISRSACYECALPLCRTTIAEAWGCRGVVAHVEVSPRATVASNDLESIEALWRDLLLAMTSKDQAAITRLGNECPDHDSFVLPIRDDNLEPLASNWDVGGLYIAPAEDGVILGWVGPPLPSMPGFRFKQDVRARWHICAFMGGD